eukprot:6243768-Prymnesium_polylepis.1
MGVADTSPTMLLESCAARGHFLSWNRANGLVRLQLPPTGGAWMHDCRGALAWRLARPGLLPEAAGSATVSLVASTTSLEEDRAATGKTKRPRFVARHANGVIQ